MGTDRELADDLYSALRKWTKKVAIVMPHVWLDEGGGARGAMTRYESQRERDSDPEVDDGD